MTTMANESVARAGAESGQSVLEMLFALPLIVGLFIVTWRVSAVINMSIVSQKYLRTHALSLATNSPHYPARRFTEGAGFQDFFGTTHRMILGMASVPQTGTNSQPTAPRFRITRRPGSQDSNTDWASSDLSVVPVLASVQMCFASKRLSRGGAGGAWSLIVPTTAENAPSTGPTSFRGGGFDPTAFGYCDSWMDNTGGPP